MDIWKIIGLKVDEPEETKPDGIDIEIDKLTREIQETDPLTENYPKLTERLKGLYDIKDKKLNTDPVPKPTFFQKYGDTLLRCGFSILSTFMILHYEDVVGPIHSALKNKLGRD